MEKIINKKKCKICGLDGIRGISVVMVILTHLHIYETFKDNYYIYNSILPLVHGSTGVQIFFVLSGYLITKILIHENINAGTINLKNFYARRSLRIIPLYMLFMILLTVITIFYNAKIPTLSFVYAYTYMYNFIPRDLYSSVLGHTWTLAVEEHFYLVWPLMYKLFGGRGKPLIVLLLVTIFASLFANVIVCNYSNLNKSYFVDRMTCFAGVNIALGCLFSLLLNLGNNYVRKIFGSIPVATFGLICFMNSLFLFEVYKLFGDFIRSVGIAFIISWISLNQGSIFVLMLENTILKYIGTISYGIYVWQGFYLGTGPQRLVGQEWPPDQMTGIWLVVITAPLVYHFFEKRFLSLKVRYE